MIEAKSAIDYKMRIARSVAVKVVARNPMLFNANEKNKYEKCDEIVEYIVKGRKA